MSNAPSEMPGPILQRLKHPVNFVVPEEFLWPELKANPDAFISQERLSELCLRSIDCWILRTHYEFRKRGKTVTLSSRTLPDHINLCPIYQFGRRSRASTHFVVIPRADGHDPKLSNFTILQNGISSSSGPSASLPHWRQPDIRPRCRSRNGRIEVLSFKGAPQNLDPMFHGQEFMDSLSSLGVAADFSINLRRNGRQWADYSYTDLVLGARNLTKYDAAGKPASKLVNAWWGEAPALLGPEPAFRELSRPGDGYIEIRSVADVLAAIRSLRENPRLYDHIVDVGRRLRGAYSDSSVFTKWLNLLNGDISEHFEAWQHRSKPSRALSVVRMLAMEPASRRRHRMQITHGARILDVEP